MSVIKKTKLNSKGFSHFELGLLIVVIAVIAGVGMFVYNKNNNKSKADTTWTVLTPDQRIADYKALGGASGVSNPLDVPAQKKLAEAASKKPVPQKSSAKGKPTAAPGTSPFQWDYPSNNPAYLSSATLFNVYECNKDAKSLTDSLKSLSFAYAMQFDPGSAQPNTKAPGYFMIAAGIPSGTTTRSQNVLINNIVNGQYISSPVTLTGSGLNSTTPISFTAAKYYNLNYSYARPGNMVLANESGTFNSWGNAKKTEAPSTLSARYRQACFDAKNNAANAALLVAPQVEEAKVQ